MKATYFKKVTIEISQEDIRNIISRLFRDALKNEEAIIYFGEDEEHYVRLTEDGYSYLDLPDVCYTLDKRTKGQIVWLLEAELFE